MAQSLRRLGMRLLVTLLMALLAHSFAMIHAMNGQTHVS